MQHLLKLCKKYHNRCYKQCCLCCRTLCESLEELPLLFVVSSHKLFMELLKEEERKLLVEQMRKRSATINLSAKPLPSFYDIPGEILFYLFSLLL